MLPALHSIFALSKRSSGMAFRKTFVLSTEDVNTYGFWIRTAGIKLDNAKKNCPAFYDHRTWEEPIGHWENLRVQDGKLLGDVVIEGADDREKMYIRKIENGDIKGASGGFDPFVWNDSPEVLKQGQTRPVLDECELFEGSITPLPGNQSALALKNESSLIVLNATNQNIIPNLKTEPDMKQIALSLCLSETATEQQITEAVKLLLSKAANVDAMQKVIEEHVASKLEGKQKDFFISLSKTNMQEAMNFLALNKTAEAVEETPAATTTGTPAATTGKTAVVKDVKVSTMLQRGNAAAAPAENKECLDYLRKHNPTELARIRKDDPEQYAQLAREYNEGVRYTGKGK